MLSTLTANMGARIRAQIKVNPDGNIDGDLKKAADSVAGILETFSAIAAIIEKTDENDHAHDLALQACDDIQRYEEKMHNCIFSYTNRIAIGMIHIFIQES